MRWTLTALVNIRTETLVRRYGMREFDLYNDLVPVLDAAVFDRYPFEGIDTKIAGFAADIIRMGIRKLYPDTIAHGIYYALKHEQKLSLSEAELAPIVEIDDCITNVLLFEYETKHELTSLRSKINARAQLLKGVDQREKDKQWLLIYQQCDICRVRKQWTKVLS